MGWKIREGTDGRNPWVSGTRIVTVAGMMLLASRNNRWSTCETWVEAALSKFRLVSVHLTWSLEISDNRSARSLSHVLAKDRLPLSVPVPPSSVHYAVHSSPLFPSLRGASSNSFACLLLHWWCILGIRGGRLALTVEERRAHESENFRYAAGLI
jgi:hypothetical protein